MKRITSVGLAFVLIGCGVATPDNPSESSTAESQAPAAQATATAVRKAEVPLVDEANRVACRTGTMDDSANGAATLTPRGVTPTFDPFYRKNGAEYAARKEAELAKSPVPERRVPLEPVDPKILERQAQYLSELDVLRAKHQHRETAAFEKERVALKDRILGD